MKKEIMSIKQRSGRARNIRIAAWTNILIPEDEYNRDGVTQKAIKRELKAEGRNVRRNYYNFDDYGWFSTYETVGSIYELDGKLYKEINDGDTVEVSLSEVAYWRTMATLNCTENTLII